MPPALTVRAESRHPRARRAFVLSLAAACAALVGGCGGEGSVERAIKQATDKLNAISAGGQRFAALPEKRASDYQDVLTKVRAAGEATLPAHKSAVALLTARANLGLGDLRAAAAAEQERRSLNAVQQLRALVRGYIAQASDAAAAEAFDPTAAIGQQRERLAARQGDLGKAGAELARMTREVEGLRAQATDLVAQASAKRDEASAIRGRAQGQSQVAQLAATEQAAAVARQASQLDSQASLIQAEVASRVPLLEAQKQAIAASQEEAKRLEAGVQELETRRQVARDLAASARRGAAESAGGLASQLSELDALRGGTMSRDAEAALAAYQSAAAAARGVPTGATPEDVGSLRLATAMALQGRGDTMLLRARGAEAVARVLGAAVDATPPMPGREAIVAARDKYAAEFDAQMKEARQALSDAAEAFASAGSAKGPMVRERADHVTEVLKWVEKGDYAAPLPVLGASPAGEGTPPPSPPTDSTAPAAGGAEGAVRAVLGQMIDAMKAGDAGRLFGMYQIDDEAVRAPFEATIKMAMAALKLDQASRTKFGKGLSELGGNPILRQFGEGADRILGATPASATITMKSPTDADVMFPNNPQVVQLRLVGGQWKLIPDPAASGLAAQGGEAARAMLRTVGEVFEQVAAEVESGKIGSSQQMMATLSQRLQALQGMMPGGGPGPG